MKHLKTYESVRSDSILRDIMDISIDIQDEGFRVTPVADKLISPGYSDFHVTIDKFDGFRRHFDIREIKDFLIRVIEYGNVSPCDIKIYVPQRSHTNQKDLIELRHLKSEWILDYRITYVDINIRPFE